LKFLIREERKRREKSKKKIFYFPVVLDGEAYSAENK